MWSLHVIDNWASSIHAEHPFALKVIVIGDQLTYLEVALLHAIRSHVQLSGEISHEINE